MNTSRFLITTACSLAVAGAASVASAQTTTPSMPSSTVPSQSTGQTQLQTPSSTTAPGSMAPGSMNPSTQRAVDPTPPNAGTTDTSATRSTDGNQRSPADRTTMGTERAARADRN